MNDYFQEWLRKATKIINDDQKTCNELRNMQAMDIGKAQPLLKNLLEIFKEKFAISFYASSGQGGENAFVKCGEVYYGLKKILKLRRIAD